MTPLAILLTLVLGVLLTGTIAGAVMARMPKVPAILTTEVQLRTRAWWVMAAILGLAIWLGGTVTIMLFAALSALALREVCCLTNQSTTDPLAIRLAFAVILPGQYLLILADWYGLFAIFIPVYAFLALPLITLMRGPPDGFLTRVASVQWALMIAVFCVSHLPGLLMLDIPGFSGPGFAGRNANLIAWVIVVVQLSDVLQFVWGKALGRRLIAPRLSPSKTWEGYLGGTLTATCVGAALFWLTPFGPVWAFVMAFVLTQLGFLGGLILSAVKRGQGVKDWGTIVAGHGGIMDRLDSLVFSAPVFFHLLRWGWSTT